MKYYKKYKYDNGLHIIKESEQKISNHVLEHLQKSIK